MGKQMGRLLTVVLLLFLVGCKQESIPVDNHSTPTENQSGPAKTAPTVKLWGTTYSLPSFTSVSRGFAVRDIHGKKLGPILSKSDWCSLAMEGSGIIDGQVYTYDGTSSRYIVRCKHRASGKVKFKKGKHKYGTGNRNNPLTPFKSVACDQHKFKYGQKFFIPAAQGLSMPDGTTHNGEFTCEDVGGLIKDNHLDFFIGGAKKNPFPFVKSSSKYTFKAYLID